MRLFLAPHHDDLLLSLSGYLLDVSDHGANHVAVVFSRESEELEETCSRLHSALGFQLHLLGFEEASKRGVPLRTCLRPARTHEEVQADTLVDSIQASLRPLLSRLEPSVIYSPLLSIHIDHALVRVAADSLGEVAPTYYEDQPYSSLHPYVLARERARLICSEEVARASMREVAALLEELKGIVPYQHLNRILFHHKSHKGQHPAYLLWRRPSP
jgi:hypothetical protein